MLTDLKKKIKYNRDHRTMVIELERHYMGKVSFLTRLHDMDKLIMMCLFIPDKWISWIHRKFSWHHPHNMIGWFRLSEAVFDWESARFTKPDKPLNARDTCLKYYPELKEEVMEFCDKYGI